MRGCLFFWVLFTFSTRLLAQPDYDAVRRHFEDKAVGYYWGLSMEDNLAVEYGPPVYRNTARHFEQCLRLLAQLDTATLSPEERVGYAQMQFECELNAERSQLFLRWARARYQLQPGGIYGQPEAKAWYRHFVKSYTGTHLSPEQVLEKALAWATAADSARQALKMPPGQLPEFNNQAAVRAQLQHYHHQAKQHLHHYFPTLPQLDTLYMQVNTDSNWYNVPAFYWHQTLFYQDPEVIEVDGRLLAGLYLHEGIPGHHYQ